MNPPYRRLVLGVTLALGLLGAIPGVAFAAQPSCGDTLMTNTTLSADLDCSAYVGDALTIGKNGITLNLNGHTITGLTGDDGVDGVFIAQHKNVTVTNGTIEGFGVGVYVDHGIQDKVTWLTINGEAADTDDVGVDVNYGVGNKIAHVTTTGVTTGVNSYASASNTFSDNDLTSDEYGVYTEYESYDTFSHNQAHAPYGFYDDYSGSLKYMNNTANGGTDGFYVDCDGYGVVTLSGNTANDNSTYGFYLYDCGPDNNAGPNRSFVQGNTANGNEFGVYIECDGYGVVTVTGNTANHNNSQGFYSYECYETSNLVVSSVFKNNTANWNNLGFYDYYTTNATWTMNTANHNSGDGFELDYPGGSTITSNVANHNGDTGLDLIDAVSAGYGGPSTVSWNTANRNDSGMVSDYGVPGHGNTARHNATQDCTNVICN